MSDSTLRYLALGDSYTIGEGVGERGRWPSQLVAGLRATGVSIAESEIVAVTGWTTDELAAGISEAKPQGPFDLVSLLIGVNNQYRKRSLDEYREQFSDLLNQAIAFAGGKASRTFVASIPDWGVTPFADGKDASAIAREIDAFNAAAEEITRTRGVKFVDITPLSRTQGELVVDDRLHPNADAYQAWTQIILPVVEMMLNESDVSS